MKDSQICRSSPYLYSELQKGIFTFHLDISTAMSCRYLKLDSSKWMQIIIPYSQQICSSSHVLSNCPTYTILPKSKPCSHSFLPLLHTIQWESLIVRKSFLNNSWMSSFSISSDMFSCDLLRYCCLCSHIATRLPTLLNCLLPNLLLNSIGIL